MSKFEGSPTNKLNKDRKSKKDEGKK